MKANRKVLEMYRNQEFSCFWYIERGGSLRFLKAWSEVYPKRGVGERTLEE